MIDIRVNSDDLNRVAIELDATEAKATKALNSTLIRMAAWLRTQSARGLSSELSIQQKILRRRMRTLRLTRRPDGGQITVWYGLDPIAMIYLGAKETSGGVKAMGGRFVAGGFIAKTKGGRQVFKRRGKARLPIEKQRAEIENKSTNYLQGKLLGGAEFEARFFQIFERELKWRTQTQ